MTAGQRAFDRAIASTPGAKVARKRPLVHLSLSPDAIARLDEIAESRGTNRSQAVEQLIRRARIAGE